MSENINIDDLCPLTVDRAAAIIGAKVVRIEGREHHITLHFDDGKSLEINNYYGSFDADVQPWPRPMSMRQVMRMKEREFFLQNTPPLPYLQGEPRDYGGFDPARHIPPSSGTRILNLRPSNIVLRTDGFGVTILNAKESDES